MWIKIGYDIEMAVNAPTTVLGALHVHPSRAGDLQAPEQFAVDPPLPVTTYQDVFDNTISRVNVPAGVTSVRFTNHAVIADSGLPDPLVLDARQHPLHELPLDVFRFLLPSRYCEVDSELMNFAWNQFGQVPEGWARVQAIVDYTHHHIRFDYLFNYAMSLGADYLATGHYARTRRVEGDPLSVIGDRSTDSPIIQSPNHPITLSTNLPINQSPTTTPSSPASIPTRTRATCCTS